MARKKRQRPELGPPRRLDDWVAVRSRFELSHAVVQMAREVGMSPSDVRVYEKRRFKRGMPRVEKFIASRFRNTFGIAPLIDAASVEERHEAKWKATKGIER